MKDQSEETKKKAQQLDAALKKAGVSAQDLALVAKVHKTTVYRVLEGKVSREQTWDLMWSSLKKIEPNSALNRIESQDYYRKEKLYSGLKVSKEAWETLPEQKRAVIIGSIRNIYNKKDADEIIAWVTGESLKG